MDKQTITLNNGLITTAMLLSVVKILRYHRRAGLTWAQSQVLITLAATATYTDAETLLKLTGLSKSSLYSAITHLDDNHDIIRKIINNTSHWTLSTKAKSIL